MRYITWTKRTSKESQIAFISLTVSINVRAIIISVAIIGSL